MTAFLYHFHGIGNVDFSRLDPQDLSRVQALAAERDLELLPTVYLRKEALPRLIETVTTYGAMRAGGELPNIAGFAVEGPLLGPQGGIPRAGKWFPSAAEWRSLASLGPHGLKYIVMAPDAIALDDLIEDGFSFRDLLCEFYARGVRVALGHFHRDAPERSAARLGEVVDFLHDNYESSPFLVLTDHLYNDMPRQFTHAWRDPDNASGRDAEIARLTSPDWETCDLVDLLGPVPAALLREARRGRIMPCINFDGFHVDLDICKKTFKYLGADRLIALTDHTEVGEMAGEILDKDAVSGLWLRDDGAVAAGSSGYEVQSENMRRLGIEAGAIEMLFLDNPRAAVAYEVKAR